RRGVVVGLGAAALGGALFVASAPAAGRAAAFWHPLRTLAAARMPVRLWVDRATVRRGDSVTVTVQVPAASRATLETRGPGEPWATVAWRQGGAVSRLAVTGARFAGRLAPIVSGTWRLDVATADGGALEGEAPQLALRVVPDSAPVVTVPVPGRDTTLPMSLRQPLVIDVRDD